MADDVIELAQVLADLEHVHVLELQVLQAERLDRLPALGDLASRGVDADVAGAGVVLRHDHQVAPHGAADLEHAAVVGRRGVEAEELRHRGEPLGSRLAERIARVGDRVVGGLFFGHGSARQMRYSCLSLASYFQ